MIALKPAAVLYGTFFTGSFIISRVLLARNKETANQRILAYVR